MAPFFWGWLVDFLWIVWLLIWMAASVTAKRSRLRDAALSRLIQFGLAGTAYMLMFYQRMWLGWLDYRFTGDSLTLKAWGVLLTATGLGFSLWSRVFLGRNWSSGVRIGRDHELICSGPYARIRHPIYTGLIMAFLGTALVLGQWRSFASLIFVICYFAFKAKREEHLLAEEFGHAFDEHRLRTGFFLPRFTSKRDPA